MSQPTTLMISEDFHSIQGEGTFTGVPMHFIRLAGCNVGQHPTVAEWETGIDRNFPILKTGRVAYVCHTYDNRPFWCDTDFQKGEPKTLDELLEDTWERHICLTGGEPLLHADKVQELCKRAAHGLVMTHVETSGTIESEGIELDAWVTVSPKQNFLEKMLIRANEIKLLVDGEFQLAAVPGVIKVHHNVFIQPINNELSINMENFKICQEVLRARPDWKLSIQLHKFLNIR